MLLKNSIGINAPSPVRSTAGISVSRLRGISGVSCMHFLNDLHPTLLPTFLPEIVNRLSLTLGEAGFASTLFGIMNLVVQPLAGRLADRQRRPVFALYAPIFTAAGAYLLPVAPSYGVMLIFVALMGTGTACFHPQGHGLAGFYGGTERLGLYIAVFSAAGSLGAAISPLYAVSLLKTLGPRLMPFSLIALMGVIFLVRLVMPSQITNPDAPRADGDGRPDEGAKPPRENFFAGMFRVLLICMPLVLISIVRDSSSQGIRVFLPLLVTDRGGSIVMGGTALFAFTVAGSVANLVGGRLSDVFGKTKVIIAMLTLSPMFLLPAVLTDGFPSLVLFMMGGACISATNPVTLAMAQEYVPESRSTASSLVMGVSWGVANMVAYPIGRVADSIGLTKTLSIVALSPLAVAAVFMAGAAMRGARKK
jgi:FSR family fosmidomycin resistance protein-like MFS transporter